MSVVDFFGIKLPEQERSFLERLRDKRQGSGAEGKTSTESLFLESSNDVSIQSGKPTKAQMQEGQDLANEFRRSMGLYDEITDPEIAAGAAIVMMIDNILEKTMLDAKSKAADIQAVEKNKREIEQKNINKHKEVRKAALINKIFGWLKALFMAIVAIAIAVVSFGTASPLAASLMATAVVMTMWDFVAQVASEASGGKAKIGLTDGFAKMFEAVLTGLGMNEERAKELAGYVAFALVMLIEIVLSFGTVIAARAGFAATEKAANAAVGASTAAAAGKAGAKALDDVAASSTAKVEEIIHKKIINFYQATIDQLKRNNTAQKWIAGGEIIAASTAVAEGATSVALADINNKLAQLKAELMEIEALIFYLIEQKKRVHEDVDMYVKIHEEVVSTLMEIINSVEKRFREAIKSDDEKS